MQTIIEITHTAESYVLMELYNQKLEDVLQHFVNHVSIEQYKTTTDAHVKNATFAFYKLNEAHKLAELTGDQTGSPHSLPHAEH